MMSVLKEVGGGGEIEVNKVVFEFEVNEIESQNKSKI